MPLNLAYRGGAVLRTVRLNVRSRSARVAAIHTPAKRVSLATTGRFSKLPVGIVYPPTALSSHLVNSYATKASAGESESSSATEGRTKGSSKTSANEETTKETKKPKKTKKTKKTTKARGRPVLTEKQRDARIAKQKRQEMAQLKQDALSPPKRLPETPSNLTLQSCLPEARRIVGANDKAAILSKAWELARSKSAEEQERFKAIAMSNSAANADAYDKWIKQYTPLQIKKANSLRRKLARRTGKTFYPLHDDRLVKGAARPWIRFSSERMMADDFQNIPPQERMGRASKEWHAMTSADKEKYVKSFERDHERFLKEYREVYGEEYVPDRRTSKSKPETS